METYDYIIKKYNINVGRQRIVEISNIGRNQMAELFAELGFNSGAEIGVARGEYSEVLCKANPNLHLDSIDPWEISAYGPNPVIDKISISDEQKGFDSEYELSKRVLEPYNCDVIRKYSLDAVKDFEDESLDFVYIDANHDFINFVNDLHEWSKKVRVGGIVSGHDYAFFQYSKRNHVRRALEAYALCYDMVPIFTAGTDAKVKGEIRDRIRSWFWVKKETP